MWNASYLDICKRHPELIAVFESQQGKVALLLRHSFVPLGDERSRWNTATRRAARAIEADFRSVGIELDATVLQWRRLPHAAHILRRWTCRYDADPVRRAELTDIVHIRIRDRHAHAATRPPAAAPGTSPMSGSGCRAPVSLIAWYRDMSPSWLGAEPIVRRHLILRTHRWIVDRVLAPDANDSPPALDDLGPGGALTQALVATLPRDERERWRSWIQLVRTDLARALSWRGPDRNEAWARWLFLIPYAIPPGGRRRFVRFEPHRPSGEEHQAI